MSARNSDQQSNNAAENEGSLIASHQNPGQPLSHSRVLGAHGGSPTFSSPDGILQQASEEPSQVRRTPIVGNIIEYQAESGR
jgi:hypothetical protein